MKRFALLLAILFFMVKPSLAQDFRPFETRDDANARHDSERYEQRQEHGGMEPLGGYRETLGDPIGRDERRDYRDREDE